MRRNKKSLYGILIVLFLFLGLGYAALTTNLSINGISHVDSASWNVYWDNVQVTSESVEAPTPTITNQTTVSYEITLSQPGDFYEFTVDAVNTGTIDAMIDTVDSKLNGSVITTLPSYLYYYVSYDNYARIHPKQYLKANTTETIKIRVEFRTDINANDLPETDQTLTFTFGINYVQADGTAQIRSKYVTHTGISGDNPVISETLPDALEYLIREYGNGTEQGTIVFAKINRSSPDVVFISGNTPDILARNIRELRENCSPSNFVYEYNTYSCNGTELTINVRNDGTIAIIVTAAKTMIINPDGTYTIEGYEL